MSSSLKRTYDDMIGPDPAQVVFRDTSLFYALIVPHLQLQDIARIARTCRSATERRHLLFNVWSKLTYNRADKRWPAAVATGLRRESFTPIGTPIMSKQAFEHGAFLIEEGVVVVDNPAYKMRTLVRALLIQVLRCIPFNTMPGVRYAARQSELTVDPIQDHQIQPTTCVIAGSFAHQLAREVQDNFNEIAYTPRAVDIFVLNCDATEHINCVLNFVKLVKEVTDLELAIDYDQYHWQGVGPGRDSCLSVDFEGVALFPRLMFYHKRRNIAVELASVYEISVHRTTATMIDHRFVFASMACRDVYDKKFTFERRQFNLNNARVWARVMWDRGLIIARQRQPHGAFDKYETYDLYKAGTDGVQGEPVLPTMISNIPAAL